MFHLTSLSPSQALLQGRENTLEKEGKKIVISM
jgi:hypothetical protein